VTELPFDAPEPIIGSVILRHGVRGTAYQRFADGGTWHSTNGAVTTWQNLQDTAAIRKQPLRLIHTPPSEG
jgi:hypothetical protein